MSKIVVLGIEGDDALWVADLDAGTVTQISAPAGGALKAGDDLRKAGATIVSGVNFAVRAPVHATTDNLGQVSAGFYDT